MASRGGKGLAMSDPTDKETTAPAPRGHAAWAHHCHEVDERNAAASKAGKAERAAFEAARESRRRDAEAVETARFIAAASR